MVKREAVGDTVFSTFGKYFVLLTKKLRIYSNFFRGLKRFKRDHLVNMSEVLIETRDKFKVGEFSDFSASVTLKSFLSPI